MKIYHFPSFNIRSLAVGLISWILIGVASSCTCNQEEDLDIIKAFKPEEEYFKSALVSLHFVMETSPIDEVDSLFRQLIEAFGLPVSADGVKDGIYTGESPYDAFDYKHVVKIRVEDGKFVEVDYNEVKYDGHGKQEDEKYCEDMSVTGTTPAIVYPAMEEMLLTTQDITQVDGLSGATYSRYRFRYAVTVALMKALI